MNINTILGELRAECDRIERAITAIEGLNSTRHRRDRRPAAAISTPRERGGRRHLSVAARRKLSRLLKQRWAEGKMGRQAKATAKTSKPARRMSRAARNRIAAAQRARWAKLRAQQKALNKAA